MITASASTQKQGCVRSGVNEVNGAPQSAPAEAVQSAAPETVPCAQCGAAIRLEEETVVELTLDDGQLRLCADCGYAAMDLIADKLAASAKPGQVSL